MFILNGLLPLKPNLQPIQMRKSTSVVATVIFLVTGFVLSACGDKSPAESSSAPTSSAASASATTESKNEVAKSIANNLGDYKDIVLTKNITEEVWKSFLVDFGRLAASKPGISDKELLIAAYPDIASNPDPFKREEATTAKADELKALRSAATPKIRLVGSANAGLSSYDMEKETYVVNFRGAGNEFTTPWAIPNVTTAYLAMKYCMEKGQGGKCAESRSVSIKVPKDRARVIEAELAKQGSRTLGLGLYSSVKNFTFWENAPERSTIELNIEGVSLHLVNQRDEWDVYYKDTILFLDGPDLQNTANMRS